MNVFFSSFWLIQEPHSNPSENPPDFSMSFQNPNQLAIHPVLLLFKYIHPPANLDPACTTLSMAPSSRALSTHRSLPAHRWRWWWWCYFSLHGLGLYIYMIAHPSTFNIQCAPLTSWAPNIVFFCMTHIASCKTYIYSWWYSITWFSGGMAEYAKTHTHTGRTDEQAGDDRVDHNEGANDHHHHEDRKNVGAGGCLAHLKGLRPPGHR